MYIQLYTSPIEHFEYGNPQSNAICKKKFFCLKPECYKPHKDMLYIPIKKFSVMLGHFTVFLG